jgi:hypothetical protein
MNEQNSRAAILLAGQRVTFWQFLGSIAVAYLAAVAALILGPLGAAACILIGEATTVLFLFGLLLFSLQRPGTALVVIALLAAVHIALLKAHVPAGLFWFVASNEATFWLAEYGI